MNIFEAKLTTEHRKELADNEFGLPNERKYPLNDESHVRSAIMFFKYAKPEQRRELAKNINLKLKKFDMKVKVGENNPFYKYIDKRYLTESAIYTEDIITESSFSYVQGTIENKMYDSVICDIMNSSALFTDESFILKSEELVYKVMNTSTDTLSYDFLSFLFSINNVFEIIYKEYFTYLKYENIEISTLYYAVLNDIRIALNNKVTDENTLNIDDLYRLFNRFCGNILKSHDHNWYYLNRIKTEIYYNLLNRCNYNMSIDNIDLNTFLPNIPRKTHSINIHNNQFTVESIEDHDIKYTSTVKLLLELKDQLENEIYIITKNRMSNVNYGISNSKTNYLYDIDNREVVERIHETTYALDNFNMFSKIIKDYTFNILQDDEVRLRHTSYVDRIITSSSDKGILYYFGIKNDDVYIICRLLYTDTIVYKLVLIDDNCLLYLKDLGEDKPKIKIININFPIDNDIDFDLEAVTEGFSIDKDGNMKISINPKKSYMDEYSEAHRILVENFKNKNYDAMKDNIAFMFLLISIIERDKRYKNREPEIVKARAFAINDFKTYLSHIQKHDPNFNFEKYYKESEFDKYIVNIPKETILGIRNLLKTIFL